MIKDGLIFATIRPNNITPLEKDESRTGEVSSINVEIKDLRTIVKDIVRKTQAELIFQKQKLLFLEAAE